MRALFGVVSMLVVLAVVGLLVSRQLIATSSVPGVASPNPSASAASSTFKQQAQQLQDKVRTDVVKALEQGARKDEPAP
jgi:hypothetical protein